jgi:hypothetical protein
MVAGTRSAARAVAVAGLEKHAVSGISRLLAIVALVVATVSAHGASTFPTEAEVRQKLHPGMTPEEVRAAFGYPLGRKAFSAQEETFTYFASANLRRRKEQGYAGFVVQFRDGRVRGWWPLTENPSYDPAALAPSAGFKWLLLAVPVLVFGGSIAAAAIGWRARAKRGG